MPGTTLGTENTDVNEAELAPCPRELTFLWEQTVKTQQTGKVCFTAC